MRPKPSARRPDGSHFSVAGRIVLRQHTVDAFADNLTASDDDAPKRPAGLVLKRGPTGKFNRSLHEWIGAAHRPARYT